MGSLEIFKPEAVGLSAGDSIQRLCALHCGPWRTSMILCEGQLYCFQPSGFCTSPMSPHSTDDEGSLISAHILHLLDNKEALARGVSS